MTENLDPEGIQNVAIVVIGRNEGNRLKVSLDSAKLVSDKVVYVDSGSVDSSLEEAKERGIITAELDNTKPFTAARARNSGVALVKEQFPDIEFLQFLDGDCELAKCWLEDAVAFLNNKPDIGLVCGRIRERHPENSIYNLLCDIEWDVAAGEVQACGGIFLTRLKAFEQIEGFREDLIAGEESELCTRLRGKGWRTWRLENEMALHDAGMTSFTQWWRRAVRCGFTYAQGAHELGRACYRERNRALFWGGFVPFLILVLTLIFGYVALLVLGIYPLQVIRLSLKDNLKLTHSLLNSVFLTIEKIPETLGIAKYYFNRLFGVTNRLIEYK